MTSAVTRTPSALATPDQLRPTWAADRWHRCRRPPVARATARSRATTISSASAGRPASPSEHDAGPRASAPPSASDASSRGRRSRPRSGTPSRTGARCGASAPSARTVPSSLNIRTPASTMLADLGERLALEPLRDGADGEDVAAARRRRAVADLVDDSRRGRRRARVLAIAATAVKPADGRRARCRSRRLLVLVAGLAQVRVQVDEPGGEHQPARSRSARTPSGIAGDRRSTAVDHRDVAGLVGPGRRVDDPAPRTKTHVVGHRPRLRRRASGTAAPSARRSRSSPAPRSPSCGRSATSESISTPRFMGPGCITSASSGSCAARARPSPRTAARTRGRSGRTRGAAAPAGPGARSTRRASAAPRRGRS